MQFVGKHDWKAPLLIELMIKAPPHCTSSLLVFFTESPEGMMMPPKPSSSASVMFSVVPSVTSLPFLSTNCKGKSLCA